MLNKHMKSSLPERGSAPGAQDPDTLSLTPADVVPTSVIARVLEKPEPLVLNSAQSSSCGRPLAEDVFVHVDMTCSGGGGGRETNQDAEQLQNGSLCSHSSLEEEVGGVSAFEKLNPYPPPPPPNPLYPGRKVIEFSSDDKVKIPKNSPLPNCTYATRQAISLSLVQNDDERHVPGSPAPSSHKPQGDAASEPLSSQSSPFSSPPQVRSRRTLRDCGKCRSEHASLNSAPSGPQRSGQLRQLRGGPPGQLAEDVRGEDGADLRRL